MNNDLFNRLEKNDGFYSLKLLNYDELMILLRPENCDLSILMNQLKLQYFKNKPCPVNNSLIFRGQSNHTWDLSTSFERLKKYIVEKGKEALLIRNIEQINLLQEFQKNCDLSSVQIPSDSLLTRMLQNENITLKYNYETPDIWFDHSFFELAAYAQHYGVPTRLLDWSFHPLVASYFSVSGVFDEYKNNGYVNDFAIWVFNKELLIDMPNEISVIKVPTGLNSHASSQQGCFTNVNVNDELATNFNGDVRLEHVLAFRNQPWRLLKIIVSHEFAIDLFNFCTAYNFNAVHLFKGPHGAAKHTTDDWNKYFFMYKQHNPT